MGRQRYGESGGFRAHLVSPKIPNAVATGQIELSPLGRKVRQLIVEIENRDIAGRSSPRTLERLPGAVVFKPLRQGDRVTRPGGLIDPDHSTIGDQAEGGLV